MKVNKLVVAGLFSATLAACGGGGDIKLQPTNIDNSVDNSVTNPGTGGSTNPCASYQKDGQTVQGSFDGDNCTYSAAFVGEANPLTVNLTIPLLATGVHIFQDSLFVGTDVSPSDIAGGATVPQDGAGPSLTIQAGNTLVFTNPDDYLRINRGSRIFAEGTKTAPIVMTAYSDAVTGTASDDDVSLWGGLQINGNGITNNCSGDQRANGTCAVQTEGSESYYGGNNNAESSGVLRYVIVKHSGYEVVEGDELNGITFYAVGSGTLVENIQVHSTKDDGIEMFGGAVNFRNIVMSLVQDDSIDWSDGWNGTIQNALIVQGESNRCIEGDNVSDSRVSDPDAAGIAEWLVAPLTDPKVSNMTCITSGNDANAAGNDAEGPLLRHGSYGDIYNSIITSPGFVSGNECLELNTNATQQGAQDGEIIIRGTVIACTEPTKANLPNGTTVGDWFLAQEGNQIFQHTSATDVEPVLDGIYTNVDNAPVAVPAGLEAVDYIGAVSKGDDWTDGWIYRGGWPAYTE